MPVKPIFQRLSLVTGEAALDILASSRAFVFGLGGVGSWCAEALVRSGIGNIVLVDSDTVCVTNVNRQLQATCANIGKFKVSELAARLAEINPDCRIAALPKVYQASSRADFDIGAGDYVIDAIDSIGCKIDLIAYAKERGATLFSSMGTGAKLDPTRLRVADIWKTNVCPLARLVRKGLRSRGFKGHFKVVYSEEQIPAREGVAVSCGTGACLCPARGEDGAKEWCSQKKVINGSAVHVTASAGMILAGLVVQDACSRSV
jgi:tRNA threonylcarbamoyladenosine dehydratase